MFKKCQVVMLPSNEKAKVGEYAIMLNSATGISSYLSCGIIQRENGYNMKCDKQHLYFLSDEEEIKEGNWYVNNGVIFRADDKFDEGNNPNQNKHNKKIIATTDKLIIGDDKGKSLLGTDLNNYLPQPSQSFIEKFVEEYNKGNVITEVMIEYEENGTTCAARRSGKDCYGCQGFCDWEHIFKLKVNTKDNTITIRKVKDSWSRAEAVELVRSFRRDVIPFGQIDEFTLNKWIEENL